MTAKLPPIDHDRFRPTEAEFRRAQALIPPDTRDLTGRVCGDPLPGDTRREHHPSHPLPCGGTAIFDHSSGMSYRCDACLAVVGSIGMPRYCRDLWNEDAPIKYIPEPARFGDHGSPPLEGSTARR